MQQTHAAIVVSDRDWFCCGKNRFRDEDGPSEVYVGVKNHVDRVE